MNRTEPRPLPRFAPGDRVRYRNRRGLGPGLELIVREVVERDDGPAMLVRVALPSAPDAPGCLVATTKLAPLEPEQ